LEDGDHYGLALARIVLPVDVLIYDLPRSAHHLKVFIGVFEMKVTGCREWRIAQMSDFGG
jgi:hypothetical protein